MSSLESGALNTETCFHFIQALNGQRFHSGFIIYIVVVHVNPAKNQGLAVKGHVQTQNKRKKKSHLQVIYVH